VKPVTVGPGLPKICQIGKIAVMPSPITWHSKRKTKKPGDKIARLKPLSIAMAFLAAAILD
jgi:hypothetical protein